MVKRISSSHPRPAIPNLKDAFESHRTTPMGQIPSGDVDCYGGYAHEPQRIEARSGRVAPARNPDLSRPSGDSPAHLASLGESPSAPLRCIGVFFIYSGVSRPRKAIQSICFMGVFCLPLRVAQEAPTPPCFPPQQAARPIGRLLPSVRPG